MRRRSLLPAAAELLDPTASRAAWSPAATARPDGLGLPEDATGPDPAARHLAALGSARSRGRSSSCS